MPNININRRIILPSRTTLTPPPVSGASIWLRANGLVTGATNIYGVVDSSGNVTQMTDLTGSGNHATYDSLIGTSPTLAGTNGTNSRKGVTFDGVLNNLQFNNKSLLKNVAGATLFVVCKSTSVVAVTENEVFMMSVNGTDNSRLSLTINQPSMRWRTRDRIADADTYATTHELQGSTNLTSTKLHTISVNWSTGLGLLYDNGTIINWDANMCSTTGNTSNTDSKYASLGNMLSNEGDGNFPFNGVISEVILYTRTLTSTEIDSVNSYLQSYYGIASQADASTQAETTAYLNRLTALGYTAPSTTWTTKFNNMIAQLKTSGDLAKHDDILLFLTETQNPALVHVLNPAVSSTLIDAPTWNIRGFTFDGTNDGMDSLLTPSALTQYTQNSAIAWMYGRRNTVHAGVGFGTTDATHALKFYPRWTDGSSYCGVNRAAGAPNGLALYTGFGIGTAQRINANAGNIYLNHETTSWGADASVTRPTRSVKLGCFDNNGVNAEFWSGQISAFGIGSGTIDVNEVVIALKTFEAGIGILS